MKSVARLFKIGIVLTVIWLVSLIVYHILMFSGHINDITMDLFWVQFGIQMLSFAAKLCIIGSVIDYMWMKVGEYDVKKKEPDFDFDKEKT